MDEQLQAFFNAFSIPIPSDVPGLRAMTFETFKVMISMECNKSYEQGLNDGLKRGEEVIDETLRILNERVTGI